MRNAAPVADRRCADAALAEAARSMGLDLAEEDVASLTSYLALLTRWNSVYNLTSVTGALEMTRLHLLDCLAVVTPLRRVLGSTAAKRLIDVGSGGGLPGVVLAIVEPDIEVCCVDAAAKKVAFVHQVAASLRLPNLSARHARVETMTGETFDVVASRAFAPLPRLVEATRGLVNESGLWLAMKGKVPLVEIEALPRDVEAFHVEPLVVRGLDAERCIVWMRRR